MSVVIAAPAIVVNNVATGIVGNTVKFTEGLGSSKQRVESAGGGSVTTVYSEDVSTKLSKLNFTIYPTVANLATVRGWKSNANNNAITITGVIASSGETFSRNFSSAALTSDYEVALGADTVVEVEFMAAAAV